MSSQSAILLYRNDAQEGPFTLEQLQEMRDAGRLPPDTLAWQEGMPDWAEVGGLLPAPVPPPVAVPVALPARPVPVSGRPQAAFMPQKVVRPPGSPAIVPANYGPKGVGGWLLFFVIGLVLLRPAISLPQMVIGWQETRPVFEHLPVLKTALAFEYGAGALSILIGIVVGILIWTGNRKGRTLARFYLIFRVAFSVLISAGVYFMLQELPDEALRQVMAAMVSGFITEIVYFAIWFSYFSKSKRVQNTYGEGQG